MRGNVISDMEAWHNSVRISSSRSILSEKKDRRSKQCHQNHQQQPHRAKQKHHLTIKTMFVKERLFEKINSCVHKTRIATASERVEIQYHLHYSPNNWSSSSEATLKLSSKMIISLSQVWSKKQVPAQDGFCREVSVARLAIIWTDKVLKDSSATNLFAWEKMAVNEWVLKGRKFLHPQD